jgi:ferredoxin--NADP+ reductase
MAEGKQLAGHYVAGWIKRGPTGVIGTNKKDAQDTVDALLEDHGEGNLPEVAGATPTALPDLLAERGTEYVTYPGWTAINAAEKAHGEPLGRPRVKFVSIDEMLEVARHAGSVAP